MYQDLAAARARVRDLEERIEAAETPEWQATEFYFAYYATAGFLLGSFGSIASLLFNVVGSALVGQHPLKLIQVYLTFPLGARALEIDHGMTLVIGSCLYIATGMIYGMLFHTGLAYFAPGAPFGRKLLWATAFAVLVWLVNFYGILSWLQPLLFGGRWILNEIPPWVALATHLVFGWTMVLLYPLGQYTPYRWQQEES